MTKAKMEAFLRIEKGKIEGYGGLGKIPLSNTSLLIGRVSETSAPDVMVRDDYVSRNHIELSYDGDSGQFSLRDLGSRNGTEINGKRIKQGKPYPLKDGDFIGLAIISGEPRVLLRFRQSEVTLATPLEPRKEKVAPGLVLDLQVERVFVDGNEIFLRKREFDLLAFLYQNRGKVCSENEIAETVWADVKGVVSPETIKQSVHSIKKAVEPGLSIPRDIITLTPYGYRLEW